MAINEETVLNRGIVFNKENVLNLVKISVEYRECFVLEENIVEDTYRNIGSSNY